MADEFNGDDYQDDDDRECIDIGFAHVCVTAPRILFRRSVSSGQNFCKFPDWPHSQVYPRDRAREDGPLCAEAD